MTAVKRDLEFREYPLPVLRDGQVLVKVRCCTICRSDLYTWLGKRPGPVPCILGHEIVGEVVQLGSPGILDSADQTLAVGDRITWTLHSSCGKCLYCREHHLSMKCRHLRKYGHDSSAEPPHLQGGFAEYCLIDEGTGILKLPDSLPYRIAAPLNCAAATIVAGWEAARLQAGDNVLIQGAGGLGCYAAAYASYAGARRVIVTDIHASKLEFISRFGATDCIDTSGCTQTEVVQRIQQLTHGVGCDSVLELAGVPAIVPLGLAALRKGGRYVEIGCSFPEAMVQIDMSTILWNLLELRGVHNYDFMHLRRAVDFVTLTQQRFPYESLVSKVFSFDDINAAMRTAQAPTSGRVAIEWCN